MVSVFWALIISLTTFERCDMAGFGLVVFFLILFVSFRFTNCNPTSTGWWALVLISWLIFIVGLGVVLVLFFERLIWIFFQYSNSYCFFSHWELKVLQCSHNLLIYVMPVIRKLIYWGKFQFLGPMERDIKYTNSSCWMQGWKSLSKTFTLSTSNSFNSC